MTAAHSDPTTTTTQRWDRQDAIRRQASMAIAKANALLESNDADELERIADGDRPTILTVLGRDGDLSIVTKEKADGGKREPAVYTARELAAIAPAEPDYLVEGLLVRGGKTSLDGKAKHGKTTLVFDLLRACIERRPWAGHKTNLSGRVLYCTEQTEATLGEPLARAGLTTTDDVLFLRFTDVAPLSWPARAKLIDRLAGEHQAEMVIIDTINQWFGLRRDEENDAGAMLERLLPLERLTQQGRAVLLIRHDRKSSGEIGDSARGSSAVTGAVDVVLALRRAEKAPASIRILEGLGRFRAVPERIVLELTDDGYIAQGTEASYQHARARDALLARMKDEWMERKAIEGDIHSELGISPATIARARDELVAEERIEQQRSDGTGRPYSVRRTQDSLTTTAFSKVVREETRRLGPERPAPAVACQDYSSHRSHHRLVNRLWRCYICASDPDHAEPIAEQVAAEWNLQEGSA